MNAIPKQMLICGLLAAAMPVLGAQEYRARVLRVPKARAVFVNDLSEFGIAAGHARHEDGTLHAWVWDLRGGEARDLTPAWCEAAQARCVNATGQVAGVLVADGGDVHAFLWEEDRLEDLSATSAAPSNWTSCIPRLLTEQGDILGQATDARGRAQAFRWTRARGFQVLGELEEALDARVAAVEATSDGRLLVAVPAGGTAGAALEVGDRELLVLTGAGDLLDLRAVSQRAQILGDVVARPEEGRIEAALLDARDPRNRPQRLGTLGGDSSHAGDLNDRDEVVGMSWDASGRPRAFLWRRGRMYDLNPMLGEAPEGLVLEDAVAITNRGWIAGQGRLGDDLVAWVLEPRRPATGLASERRGPP